VRPTQRSLEDAIDDLHRKIGKGFCDGFRVLADMRRTTEERDRTAAMRTENLARAKELIERLYHTDLSRLIEEVAKHVNLDALARAVDAVSHREGVLPT